RIEQFDVVFSPQSVGEKHATMTIQNNDPQRPSYSVNLTGRGESSPIPNLVISENSHNFGRVALGQTVVWNFLKLKNAGNADLIITGITPDNQQFSLNGISLPLTIKPTTLKNVPVYFTPAVEGSITGSLKISSNDLDQSESYVSLSSSGTDLKPDLYVTGSSFDVEINEQGTYDLTFEVTSKDASVSNVDVSLSVFNEKSSSKRNVGQAKVTIDANESVSVEKTIILPYEKNRIVVSVDPANKIEETDENNNIASKVIELTPPQISGLYAEYDGSESQNEVGTFLRDVRAVNRLTARVTDPLGSDNIDKIVFDFGGDRKLGSKNSDGWYVDYDMGNLKKDNTTLTVVVYNKSGLVSNPEILNIKSIYLPIWLKKYALIDKIEFSNGKYSATYKGYEKNIAQIFNSSLPEFKWTVPPDVTFLGGKTIGPSIKLDASFEKDIVNNTNTFVIEPGLGFTFFDEVKVFNRNKDLDFDLHGRGGLTLDDNLNIISGQFGFGGSIGLQFFKLPRTPRIVYPIVPGLNAKVSLNIALSGQISFDVTLDNKFHFIKPTEIKPSLTTEVFVTASLEILYGLATANFMAVPTLVISIPVKYTTADGVDAYVEFKLFIPWEVNGKYLWGLWESHIASGQWGPWQKTAFAKQSEVQGSFPEWPEILPNPNISTNRNGDIMLVWIKDSNPLLEETQPDIYYTIWNGENWQQSAPVNQDETWKSDPVVTYFDNSALAVWTQNKLTKNSSHSSKNDIFNNQEIFSSNWNGTTWSEPVQITDDNRGDGLAAIASNKQNRAITLWTHTSDNDYLTKDDWEI
ncbi:choice-of-anchor D domain-containing protein, partial [candidate division KSB1 bacterium]